MNENSDNIVDCISSIGNGYIDTIRQKRIKHQIMNRSLNNIQFWSRIRLTRKYEHIFNQIISAIEFHPQLCDILVIGSRAGDIAAIKLDSNTDTHTNTTAVTRTDGKRGTNITDIKFDTHTNNTDIFYTSSVCGNISKRSIERIDSVIVLKDGYNSDESTRFSCLDMCESRNLLISGDNFGVIHFIWTNENNRNVNNSYKIHDSNIVDCEFNRFDTNMFSTSSIDRTTKIWDIRMIGMKYCRPLLTLRNKYSVNCATFSSNGGSTLLTANYCDEIRCYSGPNWDLELCIEHRHHRLLRHSIIKANWHPNANVFMIASSNGNYDQPQTIDVFDATNGNIIHQISDSTLGVMSINQFNCIGDRIASTKAQDLLIFEFENHFS